MLFKFYCHKKICSVVRKLKLGSAQESQTLKFSDAPRPRSCKYIEVYVGFLFLSILN